MASVKIIVIEIKIEKWQLSSHISAHLYMYVFFSIIFQYEVYIYMHNLLILLARTFGISHILNALFSFSEH